MTKTVWFKEFDALLDEAEAVFKFGKEKHGNLNFVEVDGKKCSKKDRYAAAARHLAAAYCGNPIDSETGQHHLAHLLCNVFMWYYRDKVGLIHPDDEE